MRPMYDYGDAVRVIRNVRNDGTYPGKEIGDMLVRRGSIGHVVNVGTFLQDQLIYSVHFLEESVMVGCRQEELVSASDPWVPSLFEFRDKVVAATPLSIGGEVIVETGAQGEVLKVLRDSGSGVSYHVRFPGRTLQVPEKVLQAAASSGKDPKEDQSEE